MAETDSMEITFPENRGIQAKYKDFILRQGDFENWHEGPPPSAFDLFVASIGLCASANVFAFMRSRGFDMACTKIILHKFENEQKRMIDNFTFEVRIPRDLPDKYRQAIVRALDACAVKKHIVETPEFNIEVSLCEEGKV